MWRGRGCGAVKEWRRGWATTSGGAARALRHGGRASSLVCGEFACPPPFAPSSSHRRGAASPPATMSCRRMRRRAGGQADARRSFSGGDHRTQSRWEGRAGWPRHLLEEALHRAESGGNGSPPRFSRSPAGSRCRVLSFISSLQGLFTVPSADGLTSCMHVHAE
jgi:hypothetical protein